jgi:hypothetical protein
MGHHLGGRCGLGLNKVNIRVKKHRTWLKPYFFHEAANLFRDFFKNFLC